MNNRELQKNIRLAFESATPNVLDTIIEKADTDDSADEQPPLLIQKPSRLRAVVALAASVVLILGAVLTAVMVMHSNTAATVTVDTDSCVELSLSRSGRPLSIVPMNPAGERMLATYSHRSDTAQEAVDSLLGYMIDTTALHRENNTVLLTVDGENTRELAQSMMDTAVECFAIERFDGAVLMYHAENADEELRRFAAHHDISIGKAYMVTRLLDELPDENASYLCALSINDLNLIAASVPIAFIDIEVYGDSAHGKRLSADEAVSRVLSELGLSPEEAQSIRAYLGADKDGLVYRISVEIGSYRYHYTMNAASGEIVRAILSDGSTTTDLYQDITTETEMPETAEPDTAQTEATERVQSTQAPEDDYPQGGNYVSPDPPEQTENRNTGETTPSSQKPKETQPATKKPPVSPTMPAPTMPAPTTAPAPSAFTKDSYTSVGDGGAPTGGTSLSFRQSRSGYDVFYGAEDYPYSSEIVAMVFSKKQLDKLVGSTELYTESYFDTHALLIIMDKEDRYHWARRVNSIRYKDGVVYIEEAEKVGVFSSQNVGSVVNTLVYELDKSQLGGFTAAKRYFAE